MSLSQIDPDHPHENDFPTIEWVAPLRCWCVYDVPCITAILRSTNFSVVNYHEVYQSFEQMVGMDCSTLIRALAHIPLANEGKIHAELRRDMARLVRTEISAAKGHLATLIPMTLATVCHDGSRVDLVQDVVRPIADVFFACLLGMDIPVRSRSDISVSQIFDRSLSLNRRKAVGNQADEILARFAAATNRLKTSPDCALALTIIGHDSIVASLGHSLLRVMHDGAGKRLCDIVFPAYFPETGVPYTERLVNSDCSVGGIDLRAGDRIRLFLDDPRISSKERAADTRPFFGGGRHSCIGEEISTWLWQTTTAELSRFPLRCTVETARRRERDYVFLYYSNIVVRFHA